MKLKHSALLLLGACAVAAVAFENRPQDKGLVVHEWGTFTSFQGADGVLLNWKPLVTSALPPFVNDWTHPGLGRVYYNPALQLANGEFLFTKGDMVTLQRMETPVVYFYSDKALTADLSVQFPKGLITEWYPQAQQVGPSFIPSSAKRTAGPSKNDVAVTNSVIHWSNIHILSSKSGSSFSGSLPTSTSGSHYFAARETDANLIQMDALNKTNLNAQFEKFLFYRGAGSFTTPLRVTMKADDTVTLSNTGKEKLAHMFVLDVRDQTGNFIYVAQLLPGEEKTVSRPASDKLLPPAALSDKLSSAMSKSLVKEGLYRREATAMVNTWKSSWFTENGLRVLYVLPRNWTDQTLPMTLTPTPGELARLMIGRAEVFTPGQEQKLVTQLNLVRDGDVPARAEVRQTVKSLGRFAEPAFFRALSKTRATPVDQNKLAGLLYSQNKNTTGGFE